MITVKYQYNENNSRAFLKNQRIIFCQVDAGDTVNSSFALQFSHRVFNLSVNLSCDHASTNKLQCTGNTCNLLVTMATSIQSGRSLGCVAAVSYTSDPQNGRHYTRSIRFIIATSSPVRVSNEFSTDTLAAVSHNRSYLLLLKR